MRYGLESLYNIMENFFVTVVTSPSKLCSSFLHVHNWSEFRRKKSELWRAITQRRNIFRMSCKKQILCFDENYEIKR